MSAQLCPDPTTAGGPRLSVLIVNFNAGELLADCVGSVLASGVPVEVLVSDNGVCLGDGGHWGKGPDARALCYEVPIAGLAEPIPDLSRLPDALERAAGLV